MAVTAGGTNAAGLWTTYILRKFIPALRNNLVLSQYCTKAILPKGEGAYIARWNEMNNLALDTDALGAVGAGLTVTDNEITEVTVTSYECTVLNYGQWMKIDDLAEQSMTRSALDEYADTFAYAGARVLDNLVKIAAITTSNYMHAREGGAGGVTLTTSDTLTAEDAVVAGELLRAKFVRGFEKLGNKYLLAIAPGAELDLVTDVTTNRLSWSNVFQHTSPGLDKIVNKTNGDVVGAIGRIVVTLSDAIGTVSEDEDAYQNIAMGKDAVGWLGFGEKQTSPKIVIKRPGSQDTSNPLDRYMTIGYKFKGAARLLNASNSLLVYSATGS